MRSKIVWGAWGLMAMLGSVGCGVEDVPPGNDEAPGSVEQLIYNARCQTDALGYQTGRCLDVNALSTCSLVNYTPPSTGCRAGYRPSSSPSSICNTYINSNYCQDRIIIAD